MGENFRSEGGRGKVLMVIMDERKRGERGTEDRRRRLVYTAPVNSLIF